MTPLEDTVTNGTSTNDNTNTHKNSDRNTEALKSSGTTLSQGRRGEMRRKLITLSNSHTEETFRHNSLIDTSDKNVEQLTLDSSEGDLSLGRALVIVIVVDTDLTRAILRARKVNLNLSGIISLDVAGRDGVPVVVTNDLVPVTLTSVLGARSVAHVAVSGQTVVIVRKGTNTNGSVALGVDHGNLLVQLKNKGTSCASKASHIDPIVGTRLSGPLDLRSTAARRRIIVNLTAVFGMRIALVRAVIKELKDGIETSVAIASSSNDLVASTNDSNPDTLLGLVITIAVGFRGKDGVLLNTIRKLTTVDKVSLFASTVYAWSLLVEIDVVVATRVGGILGGDKDVVSLAILSDESSLGAISSDITLSGAAHIVTVVVDLDLGIKHVEFVASRSSDSLLITRVSVAVPATTTLLPGTIARLLRSILDLGGVANKNIREGLNVSSEPALSVLSLFIRHDSKRERNTLDGGRHRGDSDVVGVRSSIEDNLGTKTAIIIVVGNASLTRAGVSGGRLGLTISVDIDDGIVDSGGAGAGSNDDLTVATLHDKVHRVLKILVTTFREGGLEVISTAREVVRKSNDMVSLPAVTVGVHRALLDGKSEATTGVVETSDEHPVFSVLDRVPGDERRAIAGIVVVSDTTISTSLLGTFSENSNDRIVVGVLVAGVSNERMATTSNLVPQTRAESVLASIANSQASTSLTLNGVRIL